MRIGFYALGCKLNQAEAEEIKDRLAADNSVVVKNPRQADIVVLAACSVTQGASQRTRQMIRAFKKQGAKIFVIGCLENKIPEVEFYSKNSQEVFRKIKNASKNFVSFLDGRPKTTQNKKRIFNKIRTFIKIQTGCNFNCSYCFSRKFRGRSLSINPKIIIQQINNKIQQGIKEIVLTGINIGLYRKEIVLTGINIGLYRAVNFVRPHKIDRTSNNNQKQIILLPDLIKIILQQTKINRLRFGSIDPRLVSDNFIKLFRDKRLCPHLHLSIQSGSNKILKMMRRNYTIEKCLKIIQNFRRRNPFFSFSADIIIGFPGETERDFQATCNFIRQAHLVKTHLFPFSSRPGTPASRLPNQISSQIKKRRFNALKKIAETSRLDYLNLLLDKKYPVLFEGKRRDYWEGYTPEFVRIRTKSTDYLKGVIKKILLKRKIIMDGKSSQPSL